MLPSFSLLRHLVKQLPKVARLAPPQSASKPRPLPYLEALEDRCVPSNLWYYTVTNTNDGGPGSLRQAILDANADFNPAGPGRPDLIRFAIPSALGGFVPPRINLLSPLPAIVDDVEIVGETEWLPPAGGLFGAPLLPFPGIELNGRFAGPFADGLIVTQPGSLISGVVINNFSSDGVRVNNGADGVYLRDSRIGTDFSGALPLGNSGDCVFWAGKVGFIGVFPQAIVPPAPFGFLPRGGIIGPNQPYVPPPIIGMDGSFNVISANGRDGILLTGRGNLVAGNFIGTDPSGTLPLGNCRNGVHINGGNNNAIGQVQNGQPGPLGNTIDFNGPPQPGPGAGDGVLVDAGNGNSIRGNSLVGNTRLKIELLNDGNLAKTAPVYVQLKDAVPTKVNGVDHIQVDGIVGGKLTPNTDYAVDVYVDRVILDLAGNLRNGLFLGSANAHEGGFGSGGAAFKLDIPVPIPGVLTGLFSATVDGPGGTSEFSPNLQSEVPVMIEGQVFQDVNGNGQHDPSELGLNGWAVQLLDAKGNVIRQVLTQNVDLNGDGRIDPLTERGGYQFNNLLPLYTYKVREVLKAGAQQTSPAAPGLYVFTPAMGRRSPGPISATSSCPRPCKTWSSTTATSSAPW
jgi:hypothetical protein